MLVCSSSSSPRNLASSLSFGGSKRSCFTMLGLVHSCYHCCLSCLVWFVSSSWVWTVTVTEVVFAFALLPFALSIDSYTCKKRKSNNNGGRTTVHMGLRVRRLFRFISFFTFWLFAYVILSTCLWCMQKVNTMMLFDVEWVRWWIIRCEIERKKWNRSELLSDRRLTLFGEIVLAHCLYFYL